MLICLKYSLNIVRVSVENGVILDCFSMNLVADYGLAGLAREGTSDRWIFAHEMSIIALGGCIFLMDFCNIYECNVLATEMHDPLL